MGVKLFESSGKAGGLPMHLLPSLNNPYGQSLQFILHSKAANSLSNALFPIITFDPIVMLVNRLSKNALFSITEKHPAYDSAPSTELRSIVRQM